MKLGQRWPEDEMREWEVIFSRILSPFGFEKEIPIEEFIFYITGFMAVLLIYIWCDEYWLEAYNIDYKAEAQEMDRIVVFHPKSLLLVSLIWEATLAAPYQWWGYNYNQMLGITIGAWYKLPIEAVIVWLMVTFTTVIIYKVLKIWLNSKKKVKHAFFGIAVKDSAEQQMELPNKKTTGLEK